MSNIPILRPTSSSNLHYGTYLDSVNQAFVDAGAKAGGSLLYELSYVDARAALEGIQAHEPASDVISTEFDVGTPASPTGKVTTVL